MKMMKISTMADMMIRPQRCINRMANMKKHLSMMHDIDDFTLFLDICCGQFQSLNRFALLFTLTGKPEGFRSGVTKGSQ